MFSRLQTYLSMLRSNPLGFLIYIVYFTVTILLSLILHEIGHAYVAWRCGDPTAKMLGRLSLDPRRHLDPIGTLSMVLIGVGWAKPVPVNPRNFKGNRVRDDFLVSIAGITVNLTLFLLCSALSVGINGLIWKEGVIDSFRAETGSLQGMLNVYHDDGWFASYIAYGNDFSYFTRYTATPWLLWVQRFLLMMAQTNLGLAMFNFLPIPPLDGYHIFNDLLLKGRFELNYNTFRIAQLVLIILIMSGALNSLLLAVDGTVYGAVVNLWLLIAGQA